jgi:tRNA threonylcarbamoyladenosine biosynthesis protein TsaB
MAFILNIDTSSEICSVCLSDDGRVMAEKNDLLPNQHASRLTALIGEVIKKCNLTLKDIAAVALSSGPGSYTGLRIGASVAKGLCLGLGKPLIAVSTLQAMACQMAHLKPDPDGVYIPMLDARRDDIYMSIYDHENNIMQKDTLTPVGPHLFDILASHTVKNIYLGGSGSIKYSTSRLNSRVGTFIENIICIASNINLISYKRFVNNTYENLMCYEPFYLKEFEGRMKAH